MWLSYETGVKVTMTAESTGEGISGGRILGFVLANAAVAIFYDVFWILGYRIQVLDDVSDTLGYLIFVFWFVSFFMVSFFLLNPAIKKSVVAKCLGFALVFTLFQFCLQIFSSMVFAPILDPWF